MVLYTPLDLEAVLADEDQQQGEFKELSLENGLILVVESVPRGYRIERVISGNASHYLKAEYQPGRIIQLP